MKMFRKSEGFTLIELMVVVLIIGILVAIAIPVFNAAKANAQKRSCYANERTVEGSARAYEASVGALPGAGDSTVTLASDLTAAGNQYLKVFPVCPGGGDYSWVTATGTLTCSLAAHGHF